MSRAAAGVIGFLFGAGAVAALVHFSPDVARRLAGDGAAGVAVAPADPVVATPPASLPGPVPVEPAPVEPVPAIADDGTPPAMVDALTGEPVDADTLLVEPTGRVDDACPGRVGADALTRVEFFAGEPADDTQVFPIDVESDGEVAALFVFGDSAPTVRCTYGDGADAAVIESPLPPIASCLVEDRRGGIRIACPSPVDAP